MSDHNLTYNDPEIQILDDKPAAVLWFGGAADETANSVLEDFVQDMNSSPANALLANLRIVMPIENLLSDIIERSVITYEEGFETIDIGYQPTFDALRASLGVLMDRIDAFQYIDPANPPSSIPTDTSYLPLAVGGELLTNTIAELVLNGNFIAESELTNKAVKSVVVEYTGGVTLKYDVLADENNPDPQINQFVKWESPAAKAFFDGTIDHLVTNAVELELDAVKLGTASSAEIFIDRIVFQYDPAMLAEDEPVEE